MHKSWKLIALLLVIMLVSIAACTGAKTPPAATPATTADAPKQGPPPAIEGAAWIAKDPTDLPAPITRREPATIVMDLEATELVGQLKDGITYEYWTFNDTLPGPMLRARVGDTIEIRLANHADSKNPHSIDLHAVNGPGGGAEATQVAPGETGAFRFKATHAGLYVYHCATPFIPAHIAQGMYGLILIEPEEGLGEVDHEFYLMQGEIYANLRPTDKGHAKYDGEALWQETPNFVVFNGAYQALTGDKTMHAKVGDKIRLFVGNGGPNLISSFHVIGEIFDKVHQEGALEATTNIQTTMIPAGGAVWLEFTVEVPGTYILVDHSINRAIGKGAIATITVDGPENPKLFEKLN